ncbi:hypothetical protein KJ590_00105 [Patescibacteria group bacterium]|nr:hypothetical protein [Patescibacteria group bacterium]
MRKIAFVSLILPLLFAPVGSILAQETGSSTEAVNTTFELPKTPLDDIINKWLGGGSIKEAAQEGMTKAQSGIKEATGQALGTAQDTIKDEISRQAEKAIQDAKKKTETYVGGVVATVKTAINDLITKIKSFFTDLFKKPAPTY